MLAADPSLHSIECHQTADLLVAQFQGQLGPAIAVVIPRAEVSEVGVEGRLGGFSASGCQKHYNRQPAQPHCRAIRGWTATHPGLRHRRPGPSD